jgi:hypothetical protein
MFKRGKDVSSSRGSSRELPVFVTEENRARLMAIYDAGLRQWPVPFETFFVDTRFGRTHVIASGDPAAPPLLMTHPLGVGGFVWSSIIAPLSEHRRAYALDTIGDVGKSELADPARYPKTVMPTAHGSTTCSQHLASPQLTWSPGRWVVGSR